MPTSAHPAPLPAPSPATANPPMAATGHLRLRSAGPPPPRAAGPSRPIPSWVPMTKTFLLLRKTNALRPQENPASQVSSQSGLVGYLHGTSLPVCEHLLDGG